MNGTINLKLYMKIEEWETYNAFFISCENRTKTYISVENNINEKVKDKKITEYSYMKLALLNNIKNYIENNNGIEINKKI